MSTTTLGLLWTVFSLYLCTPNTAYIVGHTIFSTLFSVGKLDE
jgi:hypothetical protein